MRDFDREFSRHVQLSLARRSCAVCAILDQLAQAHLDGVYSRLSRFGLGCAVQVFLLNDLSRSCRVPRTADKLVHHLVKIGDNLICHRLPLVVRFH